MNGRKMEPRPGQRVQPTIGSRRVERQVLSMEGRGQKIKQVEGTGPYWASRSTRYTSTSGLVNRVTQSLRAVYDDVLNEPIPEEFTALLGHLEEAEKSGSGK